MIIQTPMFPFYQTNFSMQRWWSYFSMWFCIFIKKSFNEDVRASPFIYGMQSTFISLCNRNACICPVSSSKMVVDAACFFNREPRYFPFPSLWWLIFELTSCLSAVIFIVLCAYLSCIDLGLLLLLHLFTTRLPPTSSEFFGCFHSLLFLVFILSFSFFSFFSFF